MKTALVTGAAGSLGKEIVDLLISQGIKVRAMDISEHGLACLKHYPESLLTLVYGDIRDYTRVHYAMQGVDTVIHCAAMKNLDVTEGDVPELCLTNIQGTVNIAKSAVACGADCCILISTDKAVYPASAYGASKLLAEWIWRWASRTQMRTRFVTFRSGNFKQSAGNVLEVWARQFEKDEPLTVTDPEMERYFINTRDAAGLVCDIPGYAQNGDTIVPKMGLMKIMDLMQEQFPGSAYRLIGSRPGEKKAERLMTDDERIAEE